MDQPADLEHIEGDAIRKQVEFYFSDVNLPGDAHMLMKTGGSENLPVTIKHICGFPRMRKYKPYTSVVASLRKSTFLDVVDNKYLVRKVPLSIEVNVTPQKVEDARVEEQKKKKTPIPADKPWLTKGMLKPTGFEEYWADAPVTPAAFAEEQSLYDPDISFATRIETAIQRYRARRKFHQATQQVFAWFMKYGGIVSGPRQFSGGLSAQDIAKKDAAEIAAMKAEHFVMIEVLDEDEWEVDFEALAKGFLSGRIITQLGHASKEDVMKTTNVLRNFYNYILHHNVCPEYKDQIYAARKICDIADEELFKVIVVSGELPGQTNQAFSRQYGGLAAQTYRGNQSWVGYEDTGTSEADCKDMIKVAVSILGTAGTIGHTSDLTSCKIICKEELCFEVVEVEMADDKSKAQFQIAREKTSTITTLGKLHCRRWTYPLARRYAHLDGALEKLRIDDTFTLWVEEDVLKNCFVEMKMEGTVFELDNGITWLDSCTLIGPSFFEVLPNDFYSRQKKLRKRNAILDVESMAAHGFAGGEIAAEAA